MNYFLITFDLNIHTYPDGQRVKKNQTRMVYAESETAAIKKLESHYTAQDSEYSISYRVNVTQVSACIL